MKKKIILMLFFLISIFTFNTKVIALDDFNIDCPKSIMAGTPFTCNITTSKTIMINTDLKVYQGSTLLKTSGKITFKAAKEGTYDISLKSEDNVNTYKTLTINVTKAPEITTTTTTKKKSSNNFLKTITIDGEALDVFTKDKIKYYLDVTNDVTKITIDAKAEEESANVEINGPKSLEVGDNEYTIGVTAEDNSTKFYKIIVTRGEEAKSSNTDIKSIKIKGYKLNFDKSSKTFYLNVSKEDTELDITVNTSDKNASYEIKDNENLKDGSEIKIIVTAEDGKTDTYRIIIQKSSKSIMPIIIIASAVLVIILLIILIIITKKKKKNKNNKENNSEKNNDIKKVGSKKIDDKMNTYENEKTIEMKTISSPSNIHTEVINDDVHVDNDEEATRMFTYEKDDILFNQNEDVSNKVDETIDKSLTSDDEDI